MLLELIKTVRRELPVSTEAGLTGICGWSMGGYGAVRFALDHPSEVSAVCAIIPLLDYPNPSLPPEKNYHSVPPIFGSDEADCKKYNCMTDAHNIRGKKLLILPAKEDKMLQMARNFHSRLLELKIDHRYEELDGGHSLAVVKKSLPTVFDFMQQAFSAPR